MKKHCLLFVFFILIGTTTNAQYKWAAGYQLGLGNCNTVNPKFTYGLTAYPNVAVLTNQIFINRQIGKKLAIEGTLGFSYWNNIERTDLFSAGPPLKEDIVETSNQCYNLAVSLKYKVFAKKQISLWVPIGLNSVNFGSKQKYFQAQQTFELYTQKDSRTLIAQNVFTGLDGNWQMNRHFYLNAQAKISYKINEAIFSSDLKAVADNYNYSYLAYGFQTGIGYRF